MDQDHITAKQLAPHVCCDLSYWPWWETRNLEESSAVGLQHQRQQAIVLSVQGLDSLGMHGASDSGI